jgi:hypothetical protein
LRASVIWAGWLAWQTLGSGALRALASQTRNAAWAADGTPWQRFLRAINGRRGRQPSDWIVSWLDAPWQETP